MRLWLFVVALLLAAHRTAAADCGCEVPLAPDRGSIPLRGSIYLGDAQLIDAADLSVAWSWPQGTATWTKLGKDLARLDYEGQDGTELTIRKYNFYDRARYTLTKDWRAPSTSPRAVEINHHESSWTCASTDALVIKLDQPTAGVRIRWTHAGKTTTWFAVTDGRVVLGHNGCCGDNIPPRELHEGGALELIAVRGDGSEARVEGLPSFIASGMYDSDVMSAGRLQSPDATLPAWARFLIALGLIGAAAVIARRASARLF